ncbi:down syndrome cell adhesion molecule-like protein Dscam2 [Trichonephila clavipes]|nr:down syndrome cell adhesion molecule-like protein Dscam2 [Trichonephila clavipes]
MYFLDSRGSGGRADDISMSSYGKAKGNSVYDSQREPLYYPLPYATTHIPNHVQDHPSSESPEQSLQRTRGGGRMVEHTYDVPHRVQSELRTRYVTLRYIPRYYAWEKYQYRRGGLII